jgi:serine/threonine-protein kinase RsbW
MRQEALTVDDQGVDGTIELVLPADSRLVRVARLVASGVATTAGFDVDEIEDLRIAVDEMCASLILGGSGEPLLLGFEVGDSAVTVFGSTTAGQKAVLEPDRLALSVQILDVVVDEHTLASDHGQISFRLTKLGGRVVDRLG